MRCCKRKGPSPLTSARMAVEAFAPAKVNLTLHVLGKRTDGYHLIDSLVVFAGVGDRIKVSDAPGLHLEIVGPMAADLPADDGNLVLRAARFLAARGALITLTKNLPIASGIGGGSADAAATFRALGELWRCELPSTADAASLGADVPVCLEPRSRRMSGIGEVLAEVPPLPPAWLVLANPRVSVATGAVFAALAARDRAPMPQVLPDFPDVESLAAFLADMRNDLEVPACRTAPVIASVLAALTDQTGCMLARMSGSGATCFGLFRAQADAERAARNLGVAQPGWWVVAAPILRDAGA
jgi:4-diphosphocytidyl-2-C-methyl-D-erythritol kinase